MGGIPYGVILPVAAVVLAARHARTDRASLRSKCVVGGTVVVSVLLCPTWPLITALVQLSACIYVIVYRIVVDELARSDTGSGAGAAKPAEPSASADPGSDPPRGPS
jgi:hypothetical protein